MWAVGIVKHGTDGVGKTIGREANKGEADSRDFFVVAVCCLIFAR